MTPSLFPALFLPFFVVPPALLVELRTWIEPPKLNEGSAVDDSDEGPAKAELDATAGVKSCLASEEVDDEARDSQDMLMWGVVVMARRCK